VSGVGRSSSTTLRRLAAAGALAVAVLGVLVARGSSSDGHRVTVTVPKATGMLAGQYVRAAGTVVGEVTDVTPVDRGRAARVELRLDDEVWPLPRGSRFTLRWGGTIRIYDRYVDLRRPASGPPMVADGGTLPASAFRVPVEFGDLLGVFDEAARRDLRTFLDRGGLALDRSGPQLRRALGTAPEAVDAADAVLSDLDAGRADVEALVRSTDRVVGAVHRADPGLGELVVGAGTTLDAVASDVRALQATLDAAPATFRQARSTLARADGTLDAARDVAGRLGPGVGELRRIASPLNRLLGTLVDVGPDARATLGTAGRAAPRLTTLVGRAGGLAPQLRSVARQADEALNCIRPYAPEIASFGSLWASALSNVDGTGKYIRATPTLSLAAPHNAMYSNSGEAARNVKGLQYAFPRPPGSQAGQPWFLPECGAGKDALDPDKDPEARAFDQLMQIPDERRRRGG